MKMEIKIGDSVRVKPGDISSDEQSKNITQILDSMDLSVTEENQDKFFDYLSEHIKYPCFLTGAEDFSWEEPYLFGGFDQKEYERLKKKRASYTDHQLIDDYSFWMSNYR